MSTVEEQRAKQPGRICFATSDFAGVIRNGGIGTHFDLMSRLLARRGWEVHVLFCGPVDDEGARQVLARQLEQEGISFVWLDDLPAPPWVELPQYGDGGPLLLSQRALEALELLHQRHRFDIIEFADWRALGFRCVQAKRAGLVFDDTALAVKLHGPTEWQRRGNLQGLRSPWELKIEYCERYAFEHADIQLSPSRYMVHDTRAAGWKVRDEIVVAYPFPDPDGAAAEQASEIRELVFFGRLERRKGLDVFLEALDQVPAHVPVLFLGRETTIDGKKATDIIADRIGDRPHRAETQLSRYAALAVLRQGGRLAVIPSQSETFGFTVAECLAHEIPFLASRVGGIPEVVRESQAQERWLFEPDVACLSAALVRRLAADESEERTLRRRAAEACSPESWNAEVERRYRGLLSLAPRPALATSPLAPTVTVAVTYYEHPRFLPAALASLAAQTRPPDEVLVIDDGSWSAEALRAFSQQRALYPAWRFLRQENAGPGAARNACLAQASGSYFLPFDSDNIAAPTLVETYLQAMLRDASRDVATSHLLAFAEEREIDDRQFIFRYGPTGGPRLLSVAENVFGDTCAMFRTEALRAVDGFESVRWSPHEDWETLTKLAFRGYDIDVIPRTLCFYRTNVSGRRDCLRSTPARTYRIHRRLVEKLLADAELNRSERVAAWECISAFAAPAAELEELFVAHTELAKWAHETLAEVHASHGRKLEESGALWEGQIRDAEARAARAERAFAMGSGHQLPSRVPMSTLLPYLARRLTRGALRRAGDRARGLGGRRSAS